MDLKIKRRYFRAKSIYNFRNNVWGVGPKIGGNSAGLLNFGRQVCPYDLVTPWEFGTRRKSKQRQVDYQLEVTCLLESSKHPNITIFKQSNTALINSLKTTSFTSPVPTSSAPKIQYSGTPRNRTSSYEFPECGGVKASAAIDNIFGKTIIKYSVN